MLRIKNHDKKNCDEKKGDFLKTFIDPQLLNKFHLNVSDLKTKNKLPKALIGINFSSFPIQSQHCYKWFWAIILFINKTTCYIHLCYFFDVSIQLIIIIVQITKMAKLIHLSFYTHPNNRQFLELFIYKKNLQQQVISSANI